MNSQDIVQFLWPDINITVSVVALALAVAVFAFSVFSGARANIIRIVFSVVLATVIGWCAMPLAIKGAAVVHLLDTRMGAMILVTCMMLLVTAIAVCTYEIITVTFSDVGRASRE